MSEQPTATETAETAAETAETAETATPSPEEGGGLLLAGEAAPTGAPEVEPFDPEKLIVPERIDRGDETFNEFTSFAKERNWSAADVQKQQAGWDRQNEEWIAAIKADKEFGGDKLKDSIDTFKRVANNPTGPFGPEFVSQVEVFGNNPKIIIPLLRIARDYSEGGPVRGNPSGNEPRRPRTTGEAFYGSNRDG
jgi:hypothetical protein